MSGPLPSNLFAGEKWAWVARHSLALAVWCCGLAYLALVRTAPHEAFWMPDAGVKFLEMLNLKWTGGGLVAAVPNPSAALDPRGLVTALHPFVPWDRGPDGNYYGRFPVWFPLLARPWFLAMGTEGLLLLPMAAGVASCGLAGLLAERLKPGRGWLAVLLTAFATPVLFYSQIFWEHAPAVALAMLAMYVIVARKPLSLPWFMAAILLFGLASLLRREMLAPLVCVGAWEAVSLGGRYRKGTLRHIIAAALLLAGLLVALERAWVVRSPVLYARRLLSDVLAGFGSGTTPPAQLLWDGFVGTLYNTHHADALVKVQWGVLITLAVGAAAAAAIVGGWRKWLLILLAAAMAAGPAWDNAVFAGQVRSVHGVILGAPILLASIGHLDLRRAAHRLCFVASAPLVVLQMLTIGSGPSSALEWGSRLALLAYPLAMVVLASAISMRSRPEIVLGSLALACLLSASIATEVRGLRQERDDTAYLSAWTQALERTEPSVMITDLWWLTMATAPAFDRHQFVFVHSQAMAEYFAEQAKSAQLPLRYVGLRTLNEGLPEELQPYFDIVSSRPVRGGPGDAEGVSLWIVSLRPR